MTYTHFIGIDISKDYFDAACFGAAAKPSRFPNGGEGFAAFMKAFEAELPNALVVLEATGGYEIAVLDALLKAGVGVHRADPLTAKHFIRSLGKRAKTDRLDALALARYGAERYEHLPLFTIKNEAQQELNILLTRRQDLVVMRGAEQTRLRHPRYGRVKKSLTAMLKALDRQIQAIEAEIEALVENSKKLAAAIDLMTAVTGVGRKTALIVAGLMPELGSLTRRQAASLAGCAPHAKDSGKTKGYRSTQGGRGPVKRALFMAAMSARRHHKTLRPFYERLIENGKKKMVAITAVMRKLVTILNAIIRDAKLQTSW